MRKTLLSVVIAAILSSGCNSAQPRIEEDDPRFDCHTMGNRICGTNAQRYVEVSFSTPTVRSATLKACRDAAHYHVSTPACAPHARTASLRHVAHAVHMLNVDRHECWLDYRKSPEEYFPCRATAYSEFTHTV